MTTPCICVGGGGGCTPNGTVEEYLAGFGYAYNSADPLASTYQLVLAQNAPKGYTLAKNPQWFALAEACLRARALLYCTKTPGDCGGVYGSTVASTAGDNAALASTSLGLAETGASIGESVAGVSSALGPITAGVGAIVGTIIQVFQAHAQAEARQANALCSLCPAASRQIAQIDAAVAIGSATESQAVSGLQQLAISFAGAVASLEHGEDAFAGYVAIFNSLVAISPYYYQNLPAEPPISAVSAIGSSLSSLIGGSASGGMSPIFFLIVIVVLVLIFA